MVIHVPRLEAANLADSGASGEDSVEVAARVARVWQKRHEDGSQNAGIEGLQRQMTDEGRKWALTAYEANRLTARGYLRMLQLARTIADLGGEDMIDTVSLAEALEYRLGTF
jgi:magnesium chelatase family protein